MNRKNNISFMDKIYDQISKDKNWETLCDDIFQNNEIENPYKLEETLFNVSEMIDYIDILTSHYASILKILKNLDKENVEKSFQLINNFKQYYNRMYTFEDITVKTMNTTPFSLSLPSISATWTNLYTNYVPSSFDLEWNISLFDNLQIKVSPSLDIALQVKSVIPFLIFKSKNHRIYLFDSTKIQYDTNKNVNIEILVTNHDKNKDYNGTIDVAFNQIEYKLSIQRIKGNASIINNEILDLIDKKDILLEKKKIANNVLESFENNIIL